MDNKIDGIKLDKFNDSKTFKSVKCQTKYRESETQTCPYLPEAKVQTNKLPEILHVSLCNKELNIYDIDKIDEKRCRHAWENFIQKDSSMSLQEKLKQLESFEWKDYLNREKEINEIQQERFQHVIKILQKRRKATRTLEENMIENVKKQNFVQLQKKKSDNQLKLQRNFLRISKLYGNIENKNASITKKSPGKFFQTVPFIDIHKIKSETSQYLYQKSYDVENSKNVCKHSIIITPKEKSVQCLFNNPTTSEINLDLANQEDVDLYQTEIKRIIKGKVIQIKLQKEKQLRKSEIENNQKAHPLKKSVNQCEKVAKKKETLELEVKTFVTENISDINQSIKNSFNQKLLKEADELRRNRQKETFNQRDIENDSLKCFPKIPKIQELLQKFHQDITNEILEEIIPTAVERIAEKEAQNFVVNESKKIDDIVSHVKDQDYVKILLCDVLTPHVVKQVSSQFDQLCALLASKDALDEFLENIFSDKN